MSQLISQIVSLERASRKRYSIARHHLHDDQQPEDWFQRLLNEIIIPQLCRIGFESQFCRVLFHMALPAWQTMGPGVIKCIWIHPRLTKDLNVIRKNIIKSAQAKRDTQAALSGLSADDLHHLVQENMEPRNLASLFGDVSISWITLPRAYALLQENDGCCLITYLKFLNREKFPEFKKVLARIVTEFVANFSSKYASTDNPYQFVVETIFYGYEAMFWKNLGDQAADELPLHNNFLDWVKAFQNHTKFITDDMVERVEQMEAMAKALQITVDA